MSAMNDLFNTYLLRELFKGLGITWRHMFQRKITVQYPEERTPQSPRFRGAARAAPLPERRGTLHRL